ncbi:MAG: competence protein ComK [Bacilli bacterium]
MLDSYEINGMTLAVVPLTEDKTIVYECENEYIINKSSFQIINESCNYFGSSYSGRFEGTKKLVGYNYKTPIIIEETNKIIFFPTTSPRLNKCSWISLKNIKNHIKNGQQTLVTFKNNKELTFDISFNSFESQILRATKLWSVLEKNCQILQKN